jgi:hypothetical protein
VTNFQDDELDRALSALPAPSAPDTLLARVMVAVRAEEKPWYARAWVTWPIGLQAISAVLLVALCAALWWVVPSQLGPVADRLSQALTMGRVLWRVVVQPLAIYLLVLAVAVSFVCAVLWTAINRLALGGASTS